MTTEDQTAQTPAPKKSLGNLAKNFTDVATFLGSYALMGLGVSKSPAMAAAVGAIGFPVLLMSGVTGMTRMLIGPASEAARAWCENTGLSQVNQAGRNIIKEKSLKTYAAATLVMAFGAAITSGISYALEQGQKERAEHEVFMNRLPILDSRTVLRTDVYTAADLYCVNREGDHYRTGVEIPMSYKGRQYKVICP